VVSLSGRLHPLHWSHRIAGFTDKVLARLRAIEDPAERENEEKRVLDKRMWNEKQRSKAGYLARHRERANERNRKQKVNSG
jgi:hypothetical protein